MKKTTIFIAIAVILIIGAGAWYFITKGKTKPNGNKNLKDNLLGIGGSSTTPKQEIVNEPADDEDVLDASKDNIKGTNLTYSEFKEKLIEHRKSNLKGPQLTEYKRYSDWEEFRSDGPGWLVAWVDSLLADNEGEYEESDEGKWDYTRTELLPIIVNKQAKEVTIEKLRKLIKDFPYLMMDYLSRLDGVNNPSAAKADLKQRFAFP